MSEKLLPKLKSWEDIINYFGKDIRVEDSRSTTMPQGYIGTVVGLTLDRVLVRRGNIITAWLPISHSEISYSPINESIKQKP